MIEAYKVGVSMVLDTNVGGAIGGMIGQYEKLYRLVKDTQSATTDLG